VDSYNFDSDFDARAKGKWANLATWLKDNDIFIKEKIEFYERRLQVLQTELLKMEPMKQSLEKKIEQQLPLMKKIEEKFDAKGQS
jgi:hypothetical protein